METIADEPPGTFMALSDSKWAVPIGSWGRAAALPSYPAWPPPAARRRRLHHAHTARVPGLLAAPDRHHPIRRHAVADQPLAHPAGPGQRGGVLVAVAAVGEALDDDLVASPEQPARHRGDLARWPRRTRWAVGGGAGACGAGISLRGMAARLPLRRYGALSLHHLSGCARHAGTLGGGVVGRAAGRTGGLGRRGGGCARRRRARPSHSRG